MGIGIAFRKKALQSAGGFNDKLQVFEYLELSLRSKFNSVKTPELTVLHLEPEQRFSLIGFLRRRMEYGFWYGSLYCLYPKKLTFYAFPVKLVGLVVILGSAFVLSSPLVLLSLPIIYVAWLAVHYQLLSKDNPVKYAASKFPKRYAGVFAYLLSLGILTLGELAGDFGKLHGITSSPIRERVT